MLRASHGDVKLWEHLQILGVIDDLALDSRRSKQEIQENACVSALGWLQSHRRQAIDRFLLDGGHHGVTVLLQAVHECLGFLIVS